MLISLPRTARISSQESFSRSRPLKRIEPPTIFPGRVGNQSQDAQRGDALARARFAHQADHFAGKNVEVHAVDGLGDSRFGVEIGLEVANLQERSLARALTAASNTLWDRTLRAPLRR